MADIYPPPNPYPHRQQPYHRPPDQYQSMYPSPSQVISTASSPDEDDPLKNDAPQQQQQPPKSDSKPQATFLTKLYALLERPENHHMIRWDPAGEHIIVERPEQLALHVLPSIYRQSRFASFSRQLNIYGFMRKVNLRNVDPAIDDPDASTWSHPTLNRHSPPEVVANFKRRVPPRLPKPRKRPENEQHPSIPPPRSAVGLGAVPYSIPSSLDMTSSPKGGRARGFSAPGAYNGPLTQPGASGWAGYPRSALPPLTVPSDPPMSSHNMYNHSPHSLHPISPSEDSASTPGFSSMPYSHSSRDMMVPSSQYPPYPEQTSWSFSPVSSGSSSASLSSLLNPSSSGYPPARPTINTSYPSSLSSVSMQHSASSVSPDSRPATGYSVSSMSSLTYEDSNAHHYSHEYSRPSSGHPRPLTPTSSRPPSSKGDYSTSTGSLSIRRQRRHSQAMNPYPSAYEQHVGDRPSTSPPPPGDDHGMHRSRSMIQLPTVDTYGNFASSQPDFAYSAAPTSGVGVGGGGGGGLDTMDGGWNSRSVRPSTSASSLSAASQTSSSQAHTPPVTDGFGETDIHRCEY
ncbi:hypothetical protein DENSPDRAFT_14917 [Dentipellis sp. KUC8613]|nr:hypothetical protein DENSPDRAFT_14917 [Dentipellis sp. KUC8613]